MDGRVRVGVDVVSVARVARLVSETPEVLERVFRPTELLQREHRARWHDRLAGRLAAKEAVLKALGTGLATGMQWTDVEVVSEQSGRPIARLHGAVAERAARLGIVALEVSISHSHGMAMALAVLLYRMEPAAADQGEMADAVSPC